MQITVHAIAESEKATRPAFQRAAVSFQQKPGQLEITVSLPGFDAQHVEVTATPGEIAIHAVKQDGQRSEEILQRFALPEAVRADQVNATLEGGVLRVVAPCTAGGGPPVPVAAA